MKLKQTQMSLENGEIASNASSASNNSSSTMRVKEIKLLDESGNPPGESTLFDTTWLEKQFYKKQYVFNIMCVGKNRVISIKCGY